MNYVGEDVRPAFRERFGVTLERAEAFYLQLLRAAVLIIATGLIIYAAWLAASSVWKIAQSPSSVEEEIARVSPDELTTAEMPQREDAAAGGAGPRIDPAHRRYYTEFVGRYYQLFRARFEPFRQKEDKQLARDQFDDAFLDSQARLEAISKGELDFGRDRVDLETLLLVMTEASGKPVTQQRLQRYKSARKVRVAKKVQRTRTEYRQGWNSYSMNCTYWYDPPVGCSERRAVQVPYAETVYSMEFPKGTQSHTQIFRAFQDRFFTLLNARRETNRFTAERQRADILAGNAEGRLSLWTALGVAAGFLVLMFFFLLIAIERHQRRMVAERALFEPTSSV